MKIMSYRRIQWHSLEDIMGLTLAIQSVLPCLMQSAMLSSMELVSKKVLIPEENNG